MVQIRHVGCFIYCTSFKVGIRNLRRVQEIVMSYILEEEPSHIYSLYGNITNCKNKQYTFFWIFFRRFHFENMLCKWIYTLLLEFFSLKMCIILYCKEPQHQLCGITINVTCKLLYLIRAWYLINISSLLLLDFVIEWHPLHKNFKNDISKH